MSRNSCSILPSSQKIMVSTQYNQCNATTEAAMISEVPFTVKVIKKITADTVKPKRYDFNEQLKRSLQTAFSSDSTLIVPRK